MKDEWYYQEMDYDDVEVKIHKLREILAQYKYQYNIPVVVMVEEK